MYLSLPFYYNLHFSIGLFGQFIVNGVFNQTSSAYFGTGLYVEAKYNEFSIRTGVGICNIGISKSIGKVKAAWSGDPGFYTGNEFVKPGESLIATTNLFQEISGVTFNIEFRYNIKQKYFLKGTHIKLGYYFYPGTEINDYVLKIGSREIERDVNDPSFSLNSVHCICLLFGFGL
jgi:hypothetical protein